MRITSRSSLARRAALGTAAIALAGIGLTGVSSAKGGATDVIARGNCVGTTGSWKLKAKPDNANLQIEFEVDTNRNGQAWNVVITDNGAQVLSTTATTAAPSGSFTVSKLTPNLAGTDTITATATRVGAAGTCTGTVSL